MLKQTTLLCVLCPAMVFAMTVDELKQKLTDNAAPIQQMHVIYVAEQNDYGKSDKQLPPGAAELFKKAGLSDESVTNIETCTNINHSTKDRIESFIDLKMMQSKETVTDLRDIPRLLKENNLPDKEIRNIDRTTVNLCHDGRSLNFRPASSRHADKAYLMLEKNEYLILSFDITTLGEFWPQHQRYLDEKYHPVISQEGAFIKIEITKGKNNEIKGECLIDPNLDYRIRSFKWFREDCMTGETLYQNYQRINGIAFPLKYTYKTYGKNGNVTTERIYIIEQIELNQSFGPDTFKIMVPDNTTFQDEAVSGVVSTLDEGGFWSVDDMFDLAAERMAERYEVPNNFQPNK